MYEKILAAVATITVVLGTIWFVCRRNTDGRTGTGTGSDSRRVRDDIARATEDNRRLEDTEQRTKESIDRAEAAVERTRELIGQSEGNTRRSQECIDKARNILRSAKHTDSSN